MKYSFIIPVFNRPDEIRTLLESISRQKSDDFEVIIVEDGSTDRCEEIAGKYRDVCDLKYFYIENGGPGPARNFGAGKASGEYLLILDSDTVLPDNYIQSIDSSLSLNPSEAFGGPDKAHASSTDIQKAIHYSMTSFFTTGGIRGGNRKIAKFYPRSFNMGIRKSLFDALGGFLRMRFGEDIDLSLRVFEYGSSCSLFPDVWVWHKRRENLNQFFRQTHNSGIARINLEKRHPNSTKLVHLLPAAFTIVSSVLLLAALVLAVMGEWFGTVLALAPILLYSLIIFTDSSIKSKGIKIGLLSVPATFVQLIGYGSGFLRAFWKRVIFRQPEFSAFRSNFYD